MHFYRLLRPLFFCLNPELAHRLSLALLACYNTLAPRYQLPQQPTKVMGLTFANPIGLAAGFDKNGRYFHHLGRLGFGFIEIGTITPKPQKGNPKPRIFRLPQQQAIINRLGFNNQGVDQLIKNVQRYRHRYPGILGINIGKNASTPIQEALTDYLTCFNKVYPFADYISINISSPNTKNLRQLQNKAALTALCTALKQAQSQAHKKHNRYVPIAIKIAPDLTPEACTQIANIVIHTQMDAMIATNTSITRPKTLHHTKYASEAGGLSGLPLYTLATPILQNLHQVNQGKLAIIAVGGINSPSKVQARLKQGASLIQSYTSCVFHGPNIVRHLLAQPEDTDS
jgi:dihydroorotate dehydrogenase